MTSNPQLSKALSRLYTPEVARRRSHADAQDRYRQKNLEATREKARIRMEELRAADSQSKERLQLKTERRRAVDADYRERVRKKKFIKKFGHKAFVEQYLPLHDIFGKHLPGKKFEWEDERRGKKKRREKGKEAAAL